MKRTAIIGLGTVTKYYLKGMQESETLKLVAVCDSNLDAASREVFSSYPFYLDYRKMLEQESIEVLIISTPPVTHFEIASYALSRGVDVICEKPIVLSMAEYGALLEIARKGGSRLEAMYHWQNGIEVLYFNEKYDKKKIQEIHTTVLDPYSEDGCVIDMQKRKLMGTWIDSGVNILSMIKTWLPFDSLEIKGVETQTCPESGLPVYVNASLVIDGIPTYITIDWRLHTNSKSSYVIYDGRRVDINHSGQCIGDGENSIDVGVMERMQQHYYNFFKRFNGNTDEDASLRIHRFLLEVNDKI